MSEAEANARFDRMLARCAEVPFAKQPIIERSSGLVIGYRGVDWIDFDDRRWLEWGYRLTAEARRNGYATEASTALRASAAKHYTGEILGIIHPENTTSKGVTGKLGFTYWKLRLSSARCETSTAWRSDASLAIRRPFERRLGQNAHRPQTRTGCPRTTGSVRVETPDVEA